MAASEAFIKQHDDANMTFTEAAKVHVLPYLGLTQYGDGDPQAFIVSGEMIPTYTSEAVDK